MSETLQDIFQLPLGLLSFVVALIGLCVGSFANVVIYRWPQEMSVVTPRSFCPQCKNKIAWFDNIPLLSFLFLRGRCRFCQNKIHWRYPLIEVLMSVVFVTLFVVNGPHWITLEYLIFAAGLVTASFIDIDHFLLPDVITLPGLALGLAGALLNPERDFLQSLLGALFGGGFLWAIATTYKILRKADGMGGGDIKLLAWIGSLLGWQSIPFVILLSAMTGSVLGLTLGYSQKKGLKTVIPFGPYLAFSALVCMVGGSGWAQTYLHWFIPEL